MCVYPQFNPKVASVEIISGESLWIYALLVFLRALFLVLYQWPLTGQYVMYSIYCHYMWTRLIDAALKQC